MTHCRRAFWNFIGDDAKRLQKQLGKNDQRKLDEYLNGVREVERRVTRTDDVEIELDLKYPVPSGVPSDYGEHVRLMCDMSGPGLPNRQYTDRQLYVCKRIQQSQLSTDWRTGRSS